MYAFIEKLATIKDKLNSSESLCPKQDYGLVCYLCGLLSDKNQNLDDLYTYFDNLQYLKANNYITNSIYEDFLQSAYDIPDKICDMSLILEKFIHNANVDLIMELDQVRKDHRESQNSGNGDSLGKNDTVELEQPEKIQPANEVRSQEQKLGIQKVGSEVNHLGMDKESLQLARKLQAEEEQLAKNYQPIDDAVCQVCYVGLYQEQFIPLQNCSHIFHKDCLSEAFKAQINDNNFPLKCPSDTCDLREVKDSDIKQILSEHFYEKYQKNTLKFYADMHGDSISWCPTADCPYMFFFEKDDIRFSCPECKKQYCLNCRADWHDGMTCKQYQISNSHSAEDDKFLDFVKGKKFKQCPKCKFWVEKNKGCDHMTCKCKFQFCYKCGGVFMKCECIEKAKAEGERRRIIQEERARKRLQRAQKKKSQAIPTRSTRGRRKKQFLDQ